VPLTAQRKSFGAISGYKMHLVKPIDPLELIVAVARLAPRRMRV
jgi:hypothetical protein